MFNTALTPTTVFPSSQFAWDTFHSHVVTAAIIGDNKTITNGDEPAITNSNNDKNHVSEDCIRNDENDNNAKPSSPFLERLAKVHWYQLLGGCCGALCLGGQTAAVAPLGAVLMHLLQMLTELLFSAFLDHHGVLGTPVKRITPLRASGLAVAVAGCSVTMGNEALESPTRGWAFIGWVAISILAGFTRAFQTVVNGSLSRSLGSKADAATWSLGSASLILAVAVPIELALKTQTAGFGEGLGRSEWWMYTGGFFSCAIVFGSILLAPVISLAGLHMSVALGQCSTTLFVDYYGLFGFEQRDPNWRRVTGVICIFLGSVLVSKDQNDQSVSSVPPVVSPSGAVDKVTKSEVRVHDIVTVDMNGGSPQNDQKRMIRELIDAGTPSGDTDKRRCC